MQRLLFILVLVTFFSFTVSKDPNPVEGAERVVREMNFALADHNLEQLMACYSNQMDWENSFGWTIRSKDTLKSYFADWLFPRYPKLDTNRLELKFKLQPLSSEVVWIDVLQRIKSEDMNAVVRTYRQTHLLVKKENDWLISNTRLWIPSKHENPPTEFLSSTSFFD